MRGVFQINLGESQNLWSLTQLNQSGFDECVSRLLFHQFLMFYQSVTEYSKAQIKEKTNPQEKKNIKTIDWNSNGQYLASGDTSIKIWMFDGNNIKRHIDIKSKTEQLECLLFHPTNPDLLAAITKQSVTIWDLKTRTEIHQDKKEYVGAASWNPNGSQLACIFKQNKESQIIFLDILGNGASDQILTYPNPKDKNDKHLSFEMKCIQYDPLGDIFVVGGSQNGSGIFQVFSSQKLELPPLESFDAHQASISVVVFSKQGRYMATGGADSLILIWTLPELICTMSFMSVETEIRSLSFSYDEKWLAAAAQEEILSIFSLEKGSSEAYDTIKTEKTPLHVVFHTNKAVAAFVCSDTKDSIIHLYALPIM